MDGSFTHLESYPMSSGNLAELVRYTGPEKYPHANCSGYFMQDGILYKVTTFGTTSTTGDIQARLKEILDGFG